MSVKQLADIIAKAVHETHSRVGAIERGIVSGNTVVTNNGAFPYIAVCPIDLYDGKLCYGMVSADGNNFIVVGE